ncbi:organic cation transporter-like protein [Mytilus edulis]|uniref:organic cation transporter-like protein n=1 Tax=Mytilus edulis TaxID=6550 RepID=UPI0039F052C6
MKYDEALQRAGSYGNYQKFLICLLAIPAIFNATTTQVLNFIVGNHLHRCKYLITNDSAYYDIENANNTFSLYINNTNQCVITTNGTETACTEWIYDKTVYQSTLISKFDIVCDDRFMRSNVLLAYFLGQMFSAFTYGLISDIWGRKPVIITGVIVLFVSNVISRWMSNVYLVCVCQFFNSVGGVYHYVVSFILAAELVGPDKRIMASFILYIAYCIGEYILLVEAYFVRRWENLMLVISIPIAVCFFTFPYFVESPRWLFMKGRNKQAIEILQKAAKYNQISVDFTAETIVVKKEETISITTGIKTMMKSRQMLFRSLILILNWMAVNLIYYGISLNIGDLAGNVYINYAISSTAETIAVIFCFFSDKFPRKRLFCSSMIIGGCSCLCTLFTSTFGGNSLQWLTIMLAMVGKLCVSTAFFLIYVITAEIFPTIIRATAFSFCDMGGRIGSISSSYIGKLGVLVDTRFGQALPLIIFGSVGTLAGLLAIFLPETGKTKLPDTVQEAIHTVRESKHSSPINSKPCEENETML